MTARLAILLPLCWCASGAARDPWDRVTELAPSTRVRVRTVDGIRHEGPLVSADAGYIRIRSDGQPLSTARENVERVEVYAPSRRWWRVAIGGAIGAAAGIVAAFATCPSCPGESLPGVFNRRLRTGGLIGGAAGALAGAPASSYRTVFKARR